MIPSSLRRAVLLIATIVAPPTCASAQSAAVLSARDRIPAELAPMAQVQGLTAPPNLWKKVLITAKVKGKSELDPSGMTILSINDSSENREQFTAVMRQLVVLKNSHEILGAQLSLAEIDDTKGDHWVFETNGSGQVKKAFHVRDITRLPAGAQQGVPENLDLTDSKIKARFNDMIKYWAER
jgi:hypothetical protein